MSTVVRAFAWQRMRWTCWIGSPAWSSNVAVACRMSWNHIAQDAGGPHPDAAIRMRVASDLSVGVAWAGQQPSCEGTPQGRPARPGSRSRRARGAFAALAEAVHRGRGHAEPCSHLFDREKRADPNRASDRSPDHGRPKSLGSVGTAWRESARSSCPSSKDCEGLSVAVTGCDVP